MTKINRFGFFGDLPFDERVRLISELRSPLPHADEARVLQYLKGGVPVAMYMGLEEDPMVSPPRAIGPPHPLTDGVWCWPETLAYYVGQYHMRLPDDFIAHMKHMGWTCRTDVDLSTIDLGGEAMA